MKRKPTVSWLERLQIAEKWRAAKVDAEIHAMLGEDADRLVNLAGRMLYVALGAARTEGIDAEDPDVRVLRGAVNAVHDQAGEADILEARRLSIRSGLEAVGRIVQRVPHRALVDSAVELELRLRRGNVMTTDFEALAA